MKAILLDMLRRNGWLFLLAGVLGAILDNFDCATLPQLFVFGPFLAACVSYRVARLQLYTTVPLSARQRANMRWLGCVGVPTAIYTAVLALLAILGTPGPATLGIVLRSLSFMVCSAGALTFRSLQSRPVLLGVAGARLARMQGLSVFLLPFLTFSPALFAGLLAIELIFMAGAFLIRQGIRPPIARAEWPLDLTERLSAVALAQASCGVDPAGELPPTVQGHAAMALDPERQLRATREAGAAGRSDPERQLRAMRKVGAARRSDPEEQLRTMR